MRIETFGPCRLRLTLVSVPLELWLYLDPGHPPMAAWFDSETGQLLADVPLVPSSSSGPGEGVSARCTL